jgi:histidine triad (HIT) family protein
LNHAKIQKNKKSFIKQQLTYKKKMENCIFCKIAKGEIPSKKIYEDEEVFSFLDINPSTKGHTLIIPKKHYENIHDTPEETLKHIIATAKKLAKKLKEKLNATGINIVNASGKDAQQSVFHLHFHIIPRYEDDNLNIWHHENKKEKPTQDELEEIKNIILK